jgi:hypothetical protein
MRLPRFPAEPAARRRLALIIAAVADAAQLGIFPAFLPGIASPVDDLVDTVVAVCMVILLGWHVAFLPAFAVELVPAADLFPTWTIAVLYVTRARRG